MRTALSFVLLLGSLLLAGCANAGGGATTDSRVRSFMSQPAPEMPSDGTWLGGASSLAGLRGRVVFMQFAFPT